MPWKLLARDALLVALALGAWRLDASLRGEPGALPVLLAIAAGSLAALCAYLAHEWGHLLGARASGSVVHFPERVSSAFLFFFDVGRNERHHFVAMSLGGFAASALGVPLLLALLPSGALSTHVALALAAAGVIATLATEIPPFFRVLRGAPLPRGFVYRDGARQGA